MFFRSLPCTMNNQLRTGAIPLFIEKQSIAMASNGVETVLFLPGALNVNVMKFTQARETAKVTVTLLRWPNASSCIL